MIFLTLKPVSIFATRFLTFLRGVPRCVFDIVLSLTPRSTGVPQHATLESTPRITGVSRHATLESTPKIVGEPRAGVEVEEEEEMEEEEEEMEEEEDAEVTKFSKTEIRWSTEPTPGAGIILDRCAREKMNRMNE